MRKNHFSKPLSRSVPAETTRGNWGPGLSCRQVLGISLMGAMISIFALAGSILLGAEPETRAKNVILFIGDGAGYNTFLATAMYLGKFDPKTGKTQLEFEGPEWLRVACATYPLSLSSKPQKTGIQDPELVYDPAKAWDKQTGYQWLTKTATDSAAAGTAMATGQLTYNNAINWSDFDQPLSPTLVEIAKKRGKSTGVVTSVQWSHATPATLGGAKVPRRDDYETIARQMLSAGVLDVIMGAGHPAFDNNGQPRSPDQYQYKYVGGKEIWEALEAARAKPEGTYLGFRPVVTKEEFAALCSGPTPPKVVGTAAVADTLQASRSPSRMESPTVTPQGDKKETGSSSQSNPAAGQQSYGSAVGTLPSDDLTAKPFQHPRVKTVPDLPTMVAGALNILDDNPQGFFLMVEGGAIDWANHANRPDRMIEETIDFLAAIETVLRWVEKHSSWEETLVIITADHETGLIWGPQADKVPFQPLVDHGPGRMPGLRYLSTRHSNSLVPLFARGPGAERFHRWVQGEDPVRGPYVHLTSIFHVIASAITGEHTGKEGQSATAFGLGTYLYLPVFSCEPSFPALLGLRARN